MPKIKTELKCVHRHSIETHPSCFAKGLIRYEFQDDREWERVLGLPWYQYPEYKIGYFDLESDGLKVDFATMLSWAIKEKGGETAYDVITKEELFEGGVDKRIVQSCIDEMMKYKIIVTYYGTGFDLPYLRSKALKYGLDFPGYVYEENSAGSFYAKPEIYHFDLYYTVRNKLKLSRNSLARATEYLGIKGKTPLKGEVWQKAKYGDKKALEQVLEHNIADVEILEQLHDRIDFTRKWTRRGI